MLWYRLTSDGSQPADQDTFRTRTLAAVGSLMLTTRPNPSEALRHEDGAILLFTPDRIHIALPYDDHDRADTTMQTIGRACRAHPTPIDPPPILDRHLSSCHATVPWTARLQRTGRDTDDSLQRIDPPDDGYVSINIRRLGFMETGRVENWISDEYNAQADGSELRAMGAAACRLTCAAPTRSQAERACTQAAGMLGMGLQSYRQHTDRPATGLPLAGFVTLATGMLAIPMANIPFTLLAVGLALTITGLLALIGWRHPWASAMLTGMGTWVMLLSMAAVHTTLLLTLMTVGAGMLIGGLIRLALTPRDAYSRILTRPRHWWLPFGRLRHADSSDQKTSMGGNDETRRNIIHAYPLHRSTLLLKPSTLTALITPNPTMGTQTGLTGQTGELAATTGPVFAYDRDDTPLHLPETRLWDGIAIIGKPGSGKSNLIHGLLAWMDPRPGVIVDFEMKGLAGAQPLTRLAPHMKPIRMAAGPGPVLDITGTGSADMRARRFADLMRRSLNEGEFGARSMTQVRTAARISIELVERHQDRLAVLHLDRKHWMHVLGTLLGRQGIPMQRRLARIAAPWMGEQVDTLGLGETTGGKPAVPDTKLADLFGAPMNKIDQLLSVPGLWDTTRPHVTWQWILDHGTKVVIDPDCGDVRTTTLMCGLLFNGLRDQIRDTCDGWRDLGRTVTICCDELSLMAAADPASVEWFREQGRSYGVRAMYATQNLEQMTPRLRSCLMGFGTLISFTLLSAEAADTVSVALGRDAWPAQRIMGLAEHTIAYRTAGAGGLLPVGVALVPDFDHLNVDALPLT